jgi:hypothetical protein
MLQKWASYLISRSNKTSPHIRLWHFSDMPTVFENVPSPEKTGSDPCAVRTTPLAATLAVHGLSPIKVPV